MHANAAAFYQTQQIMTASPAQLVAMLYDRAIRALKDTVRAIEAGDIEARFQHNAKAEEIISHLWSTLDVARGGDVAQNLNRLFPFMLRRLATVNTRNDAQAAREVAGLLEPLAVSWRQLAVQGAAPRPAAGAGLGGLAVSA